MSNEEAVYVYDARRCAGVLADLVLVSADASPGLLVDDGLPADGVDCLGRVAVNGVDEAVMRLSRGGFGGIEYVGDAARLTPEEDKQRLDAAFRLGIECRPSGQSDHS